MKSNELIELGYLSILEIIGEGAFDLLQGQITSDMEKITASENSLGALCNIKGRVESSFLILRNPDFKDAFMLVGDREVMQATEQILMKYSPFYKLKMQINDNFRFIAIDESSLKTTFPETNLNLKVQGYKNILRVHYLKKKYHLLLLKKSSSYFDDYIVSKDLNEWEKDNIVNKDFNIKANDMNKYTPHELGYHQTNRIDFEKGCYIGQEIVARMHYRAKKLPFLLTKSVDKNKRISTEVFNEGGKKIGSLLSTAKELNTTLCLLSMNKNYDNGTIAFKDS